MNLFIKKIILLLLALFCLHITSLMAQPLNNDCAGAISLAVGINSTCTPVTGDVMNATQSAPACKGTADDDVWYSFTAISTNQTIKVNPSASFDAVIQLYSGACGSFTSLQCANEFDAGQADVLPWNSYTIGQTYYVRVHHFGAAKPATTTFDICVYAPATPANDDCAGAILLNVGATCINSTRTTEGATNSGITESCAGTVFPDDDVWFKFVAPLSGKSIIRVDGSKDFRPVIEVFNGCGGASIACQNGTSHNVIMKLELTSLTPGNTYYFRVFDYYAVLPTTLTFDLCVLDPPAPTNDDCVNATLLPAATSCSYMSQTLNGASASAGHPTPCLGNPNDDLWYKFTAATTKHMIKVLPSSGFDAVVQILDGCGPGATVLKCSTGDSTMGDEEILKITGLTPSNTYYVRVFSFESVVTPTTSFEICSHTVPENDDCSEATSITVSTSGNIVAGSVAGATKSMVPCASLSSSEDDVWFKFVASASDNNIVVEGSPGMDAVVQVLDGCSGSSIACKNDSSAGQTEKIIPSTLVSGNTYYVRVYDYYSSEPLTQTFNIYVRGLQVAGTLKTQVENSLNVYPVPANNNLNVNFTTNDAAVVTLKLLSVDGKPVYTENLGMVSGEVNENLDISKFNQGIYLLQIIIDEQIISKKFIVNGN